jgi:hypothetical protein
MSYSVTNAMRPDLNFEMPPNVYGAWATSTFKQYLNFTSSDWTESPPQKVLTLDLREGLTLY